MSNSAVDSSLPAVGHALIRHLSLGAAMSSPTGRNCSLTPPTPASGHSFHGQTLTPQHRSAGLVDPVLKNISAKCGFVGGGIVACSSPPPASSNPENNACHLIDYRGARVAAFNVDGRQLVCLPQAFELFLKHLVGGLHTVYTKLKRLDILPVVCNVEQVRVLRGLGAIQPGVNRCKLISPAEFDILYDDCTNSSARPGRPPKRSAMSVTPDSLDNLKKNRSLIGQMAASGDYFNSVNNIVDGQKALQQVNAANPFIGNANGYNIMSFAADLHKSSLLAPPGFPYPPHLAAAAAAAAGHLAFMPLAAAAHPSMMNFAVANHLGMRALDHVATHSGPDTTSSRSRNETPRYLPPHGVEFNNNKTDNEVAEAASKSAGYRYELLPSAGDGVDRPLNLETHKRATEPSRDSASEQDSCSVVSALSDNVDSRQVDLSKKSLTCYNCDDKLRNQRNVSTDDDQPSDDDAVTTGNGVTVVNNQPNSPQTQTTAVEPLFVNIQGMLKLAVEKSREMEQQFRYEKATLQQTVNNERDLCETLSTKLHQHQKIIASLQRQLKKERKTRRRLEQQLQQLTHPTACYKLSPGGSTDDDEHKRDEIDLEWPCSIERSGERSSCASSSSNSCTPAAVDTFSTSLNALVKCATSSLVNKQTDSV